MKIQHLAVIFIIIIMPISMVLATYVGNLIDVSNKEAKYDAVLMNATYDAVRAYQLNSLNNTYANIHASRMRDLNATVNTFFNSLATGLSNTGYKKTELNEYIPAILITLYDGYYVYGPFENYATVSGNKVKYITDESSGNPNSEYGIKPYTYYTCQYKEGGNYNIVVNYTLDNYISIAGTYKVGDSEKYITASGFYINPNNVSINDNNHTVTIGEDSSQVRIEPEVLSEWLSAYNQFPEPKDSSNFVDSQPRIAKYRYVNMNGEKYYLDTALTMDEIKKDKSYQDYPIFKLDGNLKIYISPDNAKELTNYLGYEENNVEKFKNKNNGDAVDMFKDINCYYYYKNAMNFSIEAYKALSQINLDNSVIVTDAYNNVYNIDTANFDDSKTEDDNKMTSHIKSDYDTKNIFDYEEPGNDPELDSSSFNQHRMDVIISSIEQSLATSIANFNNYQSATYDYRMPTVSEIDWDKIANNINIVAFMQGMVIGNFKFYNNYSVVSDTKNKEFMSKQALRVQEANNNISPDDNNININYKNNTTKFHMPTCKEFNNNNNDNIVGYRMIDYEIQSFQYKDNDAQPATENYYMQAGTGGYECVISNNQPMWTYDELMTGTKNDKNDTQNKISPNVRKAYITALAREKQNSYQNLEHLNEEVVVNN